MATDNQKNLIAKSEEYASSFDKGDLALPPAKKYLVGKLSTTSIRPTAYICVQ
jgi:carbonic anhydrase